MSTVVDAAKRSGFTLRGTVTAILGILILGFSMLGFVGKFVEFMHTFREDAAGVFAITPMVNYGLASLGFLLLLVWAATNGMFHDIERPKYTMLETERDLDRSVSDPTSLSSSRHESTHVAR